MPPSVRALLVRALYRLGWLIAARLPGGLVDWLVTRLARRAAARGGWHVGNLRHNLATVLERPAEPALVVAALRSHLRNVYEQLALPGWSREQIVARVEATGLEPLRAAFATRGAVCALPHSGNWDLAGAWACSVGLPVTTVAERLSDAEFAAFTRFRTRLGMEVLSHRDRDAIPTLVQAVRRGRVVCLLADRDLTGDGLPVTWAGRSVTMPVGPALVAQRTGAALFAVVAQFTPTGLVLRISPEVEPGDLISMTQQIADHFTAAIAEKPEDWHMFQPFFDLERSGRSRGQEPA
jgi:phosphatidylinositol dimannoside acyltransferase